MDYFWTPNLDQLLGLANGYNDDPRFRTNFDKMHPKLAEFMLEAVKVYVEKGWRVKDETEKEAIIKPSPSQLSAKSIIGFHSE